MSLRLALWVLCFATILRTQVGAEGDIDPKVKRRKLVYKDSNMR